MFSPRCSSTSSMDVFTPPPPWRVKAAAESGPTPGPTASSVMLTPESALSGGKRGRPRADLITHLMLEGSTSPSEIKCRVCHRVFPREKSLQAHLRTHTGERPYACDYPGCTRAFTQSGQLKTHQRLHAGEKPFVCSAPLCNNRYTHANRTCPLHPLHKPRRSNDVLLQPLINDKHQLSDEVLNWLEKYRRERQERNPAKTNNTPLNECETKGMQENAVIREQPQGSLSTPAKNSPLNHLGNGANQYAIAMNLTPMPTMTTTSMMATTMTTPVRGIANAFFHCGTPTSSPLSDETRPWISRAATKRVLVRELEQQENLGPASALNVPSSSPSIFNLEGNNEGGESGRQDVPVGPQEVVKGKRRVPLSPIGRRTTLGDITPSDNPVSKHSGASSSLKPKKRWLKEVFEEEEKKRRTRDENHNDDDDEEPLAKPISWNNCQDDEVKTSKVPSSAFMLAASALMELGDSSKRTTQAQPQLTSLDLSVADQPLNLSLSTSNSLTRL